jgi:hypothetical protein
VTPDTAATETERLYPMKHYRIEIENIDDNSYTECDRSTAEDTHTAHYELTGFTNDNAHIGDAWVCHRHIDDGTADIEEKAQAYK